MSNTKSPQITPQQRVELARSPKRPNVMDYIAHLFTDFFEIRGDRRYSEDPSITCGIAKLSAHWGENAGLPVTVAGHRKGKTLEENIACNFGMPHPEGYRKFQRAIAQAAKFGRPVITFVDTPGAYPGTGAEERGQGEAIAKCLMDLSELPVPVLAVITGEGGSGGALALALADRVIMLENAIYSILSPEGFASILWKDSTRSAEACDVMKLTAEDLLSFSIIDHIIAEPQGGVGEAPDDVYRALITYLSGELSALLAEPSEALTDARYAKFRQIGRL